MIVNFNLKNIIDSLISLDDQTKDLLVKQGLYKTYIKNLIVEEFCSSVHCNEEDIIAALKILAWDEKVLVEGAAALALAGFLKHESSFKMETSVILLCGANFDKTSILKVIA